MFKVLKKFFSRANLEADSESEENQLWIMIKENDFFREGGHLEIIDELSEIIESKGLGELDGHSSGAHQLEVNFYDVPNYKASVNAVNAFFKQHPNIEYTVSKEYETTYEKP